MVSGRSLTELRTALMTGLVGVILTGTGSPAVTVTLKQSDGVMRVIAGARRCSDGGVLIIRKATRTISVVGSAASGGTVQRLCATTYRIEVGLDVPGVAGATLQGNLDNLAQQLANAVEATLEPSTGTNEGIASWDLPEAIQDGNFVVLSMGVTINHFWQR